MREMGFSKNYLKIAWKIFKLFGKNLFQNCILTVEYYNEYFESILLIMLWMWIV